MNKPYWVQRRLEDGWETLFRSVTRLEARGFIKGYLSGKPYGRWSADGDIGQYRREDGATIHVQITEVQ